jgi:hypothetical protein
MKNIYFILIISISSIGSAVAQPILTSANFAQNINESQLFYVADSISVINTTIGADVIFDYSGLEGYGNTKTQYVIDPTSTTYGSSYPSATLADSTQGTPVNKNYVSINGTDSLTKEGIVAEVDGFGTVIGQYNLNPEIMMKFPFSYGDSYTDNYSGSFTVQTAVPVTTEGNGNAIVNADSWGTLKLPMGVSIDSVLRVKTTEYLITDTISLGPPSNLTIPPITISGEYINYYKPSLSSFPLLTIIKGSYNQGENILDSTQNILSQYPLEIPNSVQLINEQVKSSLFPNPTNSNATTLTLDLKENKAVSVSILNSLGQNVNTVFSGSLNKGENGIKINTTNLSKGIYFINITIDQQLITKKLMVE